jgi:Ni/Co efflux regulator RcnB
MKRMLTAAAAAVLALTGAVGAAGAQPYDHRDNGNHGYQANGNHNGSGHSDWRRGGRIQHTDWNRGQRVDWRRHHLRQPPRGYEWRQVDGQYVMAAAATGLIASILAANH